VRFRNLVGTQYEQVKESLKVWERAAWEQRRELGTRVDARLERVKDAYRLRIRLAKRDFAMRKLAWSKLLKMPPVVLGGLSA